MICALPPVIASLILGALFSPIFLIPVAIYLFSLVLGSLIIGMSLFEKIFLPIVLLTMHMVWGAGYLLSPKRLKVGGQ